MSKFDDIIKDAKLQHEPSSSFVEMTMRQINNQQPKKRHGFKQWGTILMGGLAVLAIIVIFGMLHVADSNNRIARSSGSSSANQGGQTSPSQTANGSTATGTNDASLASDLNGVNNSLLQESSDQTSANSALNDQSQQISVPTD